MLNRWIVVCLLVLPLLVSAKDAKDKGFSGKWVMDKNSSHGSVMITDLRQTIKVSGNEVSIQSTFAEPPTALAPLLYLGIMTSSLSLKTDGSDSPNQIGPFMQMSKTTIDGNVMTTDWSAVVKGDPVQGKWVRTLSDDGKHMTLEITESSTQGQHGDATVTFSRK